MGVPTPIRAHALLCSQVAYDNCFRNTDRKRLPSQGVEWTRTRTLSVRCIATFQSVGLRRAILDITVSVAAYDDGVYYP